uniref:TspO/MBR family protein n=1 Tax=Caenorhabditis japonica TaxID=281687 RepID=A0A8R1EFC2_CAEJA
MSDEHRGEFERSWRHVHFPHSFPDAHDAFKEFIEKENCRLCAYETMPFWTTQDTRNAALSTLIPAGAATAAFVAFAKDQHIADWWSTIKKPKWAPKDVRIYSAVDLLTLSPLGYASYLVYKNGGGFDYNDTKLALGIYGANLVFAIATIPIIKKKELGCLWKNTAVVSLTAAGAAYTFYKIDKKAGLLLIPYAIWTAFYTYLTYSIKKENDPVKDL